MAQLALAGLEAPQPRPVAPAADHDGRSAGPAAGRPEVGRPEVGHLRAAMRLSRAMRRLPQHSRAETEAGIAICRHLQALLAESPPH